MSDVWGSDPPPQALGVMVTSLEVEVDLDALAGSLAADLNDSALLQFMLDVDEYRADLGFTIKLRDALTRAINLEVE